MVQRLDNYYLAVALERLSKYYSLMTPEQASGQAALNAIRGFTNVAQNSRIRPDRITTYLMDLIINTNYGALPVHSDSTESLDLLRALDQLTTEAQTNNAEITTSDGLSAIARFAQVVKVYNGVGFTKPWAFPVIPEMLGIADGQGNAAVRRLSAIQLNTTRVAPANKYTEAISAFMNGIPSIEMARAVPYLDIKFHFGREAVDSNGILNAPSIFKFLEGAVSVTNNTPLARMVYGNRTRGSIEGSRNTTGFLSVSGMELFTSPQTMVNGNTPIPTDGQSSNLRTTPVIDKFRPFMTFKSFTIDVAPSVGLMSFKTAKMEFVLHDHSRLHEIADLIKPDLYGTTELIVEYGWSHPDKPNSGNPYAVLLNCTRIKEKYGIRNMQMTFDEVGQVSITLDLFTRGVNEFATETIATASEGTQRSLQVIQRLAEAIRLLRERVFRNNTNNRNTSGQNSREIRGTQVLDAASDIQNNIRLSGELITNLNQLERDLRRPNTNTPDVSALLTNLRSLYDSRRSTNRVSPSNNSSANSGGAVLQLQRSLQAEIRDKLSVMNNRHDPFYPPVSFRLPGGTRQDNGNFSGIRIGDSNVANDRNPIFRRAARVRNARRQAASRPRQSTAVPPIDVRGFENTFFSLGKLLMTFVGVPLASQEGRFSEVQFIFYPFNAYAGFANGLNVSQFMIDARFFMQEYLKFRTETISRAGNVTLNEFMQFIGSSIIDDPGAAVYGIDDLYERTRDSQTGVESLQPRGNSVEFQTRLENRLRTVTPDGSFRMPQLSFYIESLPKRVLDRNFISNIRSGTSVVSNPEDMENSETILRIHVFDQQTTQHDAQMSLLAAARDNTLNSISQIPSSQDSGEPAVLNSHRITVTQIIDQARADGIIEAIPNSNQAYRINGGAKAIKNFVMNTMPYIIYGSQATNVMRANVSSQNEPALSTVNMLRNLRASPIRPTGEQFGGLPLTVVPMELSLTTMGCSLISFAQQIFIDFQTGTSIDNIYGVSGLQHKLTPGEFITEIKFAPLDAYGRYSSFLERINNFVASTNDIQGRTQNNQNTNTTR